jgi:hypothetical protein
MDDDFQVGLFRFRVGKRLGGFLPERRANNAQRQQSQESSREAAHEGSPFQKKDEWLVRILYAVWLVVIKGMGHTWPGAADEVPGQGHPERVGE